MKILFFDLHIPDLLNNKGKTTGGAAVRINNLASGLQSLGCEVGVLTWKGFRDKMTISSPYHLIETYPLHGGIKYLRKVYLNLFKIINATRRFNPDVLVANGKSMNAGFMAISSKLLNIPLVYLVTNNFDVDFRAEKSMGYVDRILFQFTLHTTSLIICQNSYQLQCLKKRYKKAEYLILYNPFDVSQINNELKFNRKYIAWVGVFSSKKNLPALLSIVRSMPTYNFKIAGAVHNNLTSEGKFIDKETKNALNDLNREPNVEFVGVVKRDEIITFLSEAYALINTSHFEGFPNSFLESFAAGTPVVTRRDIDPDHIIERNKLGQIVDSYNEAPEALINLINSPEYTSIAQNCQNYLKGNHDLTQICERFLEYLSGLQNRNESNKLK